MPGLKPSSTVARLQPCVGDIGATLGATGAMAMTNGQWTTYDEAAATLGISGDAVRRRAARGRWARMPGNDGRMCQRGVQWMSLHGQPGTRRAFER